MSGYESIDSEKAEMWAALSGPPDQFVDLVSWFSDNPACLKNFNRTSLIWNKIDLNEVIRKFKIACIEHALSIARPLQLFPPPKYWHETQAAINACIDVLNGIGDLDLASEMADFASQSANHSVTTYFNVDASYAARRTAETAFFAIQTDDNAAWQAAVYASDVRATRSTRTDVVNILVNIILQEYERGHNHG